MAIDKFQGETRWLSNFETCSIEYEGEIYRSTEHLYQALKTKDPEQRRAIREAKTPREARNLGQKVTDLPENWNEIKGDIMEVCLRLKFPSDDKDPNYRYTRRLIETGGEELIEGNTWGDMYFGVCDGFGENVLGKLLMKIRLQRAKSL